MLTTITIDVDSSKIRRKMSKDYPPLPAIPSLVELLSLIKPVVVKKERKKTKEYKLGFRLCRCGCKKTFQKVEMVYVGCPNAKRKNTFYHQLCVNRLKRLGRTFNANN